MRVGEKFDGTDIKAKIEEIKAKLPFLELAAIDGIEFRRSGPNFVTLCPFHREGSASFTVHALTPTRGHCYGCGWDGDIFDFHQGLRGGDFFDVLSFLASQASVSVEQRRIDAAQVPQMTVVASKAREKPPLPRLRALSDDEIKALAALRGLDPAGVAAAAADKRVGFCKWPQWLDRRNAWTTFDDAGPAWVVTDSARWVAQFRKMDGGVYQTKEGHKIKAWTKGWPGWPLGASEMGDRVAVLLVEGGADMLAAYHFLEGFRRLRSVAVCSILGGSSRIAEPALPFFRRKRVRIFMHDDEIDPKTGLRAGCEAAARWTEQLTAAGAAVETFSFAGLTRRDGAPVNDLNDLALVEEGAWLDGDLRAAFFDFDF